MPNNPVLVTASEVPTGYHSDDCLTAGAECTVNCYAEHIAAILSDPAIQTLIVRKVVEACAPDAFYPIPQHEMLTILPTRGPDHA